MHLAVDVGGTFTDLVVAYEDGRIAGYKTPSTRPDIIQGLFNGIGLIAESLGVGTETVVRRLKRIDFGTTAATNALLEGKAARTGLIVTSGFRDVLVIREGGKADSYNMKAVYPEPYIPRALTFEVRERVTAEGDVLVPLDEASVLEAIEGLRRAEVEAVAISLIWSITNSRHEQRIAELVREHLPGVAISLGHEVHPCLREYRRTIACAIDASLKPLVASNVEILRNRLDAAKFAGTLSYITSSGGKASADDILRRPVYLCFSGPSAAPEAGRRYAGMEGIAHGNVITIDMGGTSFDVSITTGGELPMHREGAIAGHLFGVPSVEIHSVGSGGGSIARVDAGGYLHVGPESAGSRPGPACYGRGGASATVTDANLISGYLGQRFSSGGGMSLSRELASVVITEQVAGPLKMSEAEAANLISFACEQEMVVAIEDITIRRGLDPRNYVMVAGGAAAGVHAISIAREMGIKTVIIPRMAGVLSAYGILVGEVTFGFARSLATATDSFDAPAVKAVIEALADEGTEFLEKMAVDGHRRRLQFSCQARYRGQVWELTLPFEPSELMSAAGAEILARNFHALHRSLYQAASEGEAVEIIEWNVIASGTLGDVKAVEIGEDRLSDHWPAASSGVTRLAYFRTLGKAVETPVYASETLPVGQLIQGPIIIDEELTTIVIPPDVDVRLSPRGNYVVEID